MSAACKQTAATVPQNLSSATPRCPLAHAASCLRSAQPARLPQCVAQMTTSLQCNVGSRASRVALGIVAIVKPVLGPRLRPSPSVSASPLASLGSFPLSLVHPDDVASSQLIADSRRPRSPLPGALAAMLSSLSHTRALQVHASTGRPLLVDLEAPELHISLEAKPHPTLETARPSLL